MLARLQDFASQVEAGGSLSQGAPCATGINDCLNRNLALFSDVATLTGGPQDFASLLTGTILYLSSHPLAAGALGDLSDVDAIS
jgi:hypothetical protein